MGTLTLISGYAGRKNPRLLNPQIYNCGSEPSESCRSRRETDTDSFETLQIQDPSGKLIIHERAVSSGDHTFIAHMDGKYLYCFSNEHWWVNSKEVSFNVHGIVYVPESEAPSDPLESEGTIDLYTCQKRRHQEAD